MVSERGSDNTPSPRPSQFYRWLIKLTLAASVGAVFVFVVGFIWVSAVLDRPSLATKDIILEIKPGDGRVVISQRLNQIGLPHHPLIYRIEEWRRGKGYLPKAGEYQFAADGTLSEAMDIIHKGVPIQHDLTISEGLSSQQIVDLLRGDDRLTGEITEIPEEGSLLPETYAFSRHTDRNALIRRMQQSREIKFAEIWASRDPDHLLKTMQDAVILASIVEKETGIVGERGLVASVFLNRIQNSMKLQSDPTVLYGLEKDGIVVDRLLRSHLKHNSPWNTYRIKALPPSPISNPGLASFIAVVKPERSDYFYFVADGKGGHRFAKTYEDHKANIKLWKDSANQN
jgi:UPF0755 protein